MMNRRIYIDLFYLLLLGATLGAVLVLGALVAPVVFNSDSVLSVALLDHYSEGVIMAEIFHRFTYWGYAVVLSVIMYEGALHKMMERDKIAGASAFGVVATLLMFCGVYTPKILALQQAGPEATMSDAFNNLHVASELDFKLLTLALAGLFVRRIMLLRTVKV